MLEEASVHISLRMEPPTHYWITRHPPTHSLSCVFGIWFRVGVRVEVRVGIGWGWV